MSSAINSTEGSFERSNSIGLYSPPSRINPTLELKFIIGLFADNHKKFLLLSVVCFYISFHDTSGIAQNVSGHPGNGLPATDALQRTLSTNAETGNIKSEKFVAMFYWNWHKGWDGTTRPKQSKIYPKY